MVFASGSTFWNILMYLVQHFLFISILVNIGFHPQTEENFIFH